MKTYFEIDLDGVTGDLLGVNPYQFKKKFSEILTRRYRAETSNLNAHVIPSDLIWQKADITLRVDRALRVNGLECLIGITMKSPCSDALLLFRLAMNNLLRMSTPVLWRRDMYEAASAECVETFRGRPAELHVFDPPCQLWIPAVDIPVAFQVGMDPDDIMDISKEEVRRRGWVEDAIIVCNLSHPEIQASLYQNDTFVDKPMLMVSIFGNTKTLEIKLAFQFAYAGQPIRRRDCRYFAMAYFMHEPIAKIITRKPSKDEAKKLKVCKLPSWETREIILRRVSSGRGDSKSDIEWSCQWAVRGHWRNQPYPSTGEVKPKFIASYIKGPSDKPFKTPSRSVIVVGR